MRQGMEMRPLWMTCVAAVALILVLPACGERGHTAATSSGAPSHRPISASRLRSRPTSATRRSWTTVGSPCEPGTQFVWEGHALDDEDEIPRRVVFTVTDLTKVIDGVRVGRRLGARLHRRLARGGRACVLRPGRRRERVALRRVPGGIRGGQDRQDARSGSRVSRARRPGSRCRRIRRRARPSYAAGLGPSGRLERPGGGVSGGRARPASPSTATTDVLVMRRVQPHRAGRASSSSTTRRVWGTSVSGGEARTRTSARCWC